MEVIIKPFYPRALKAGYLFIYIYIFMTPIFETGRYCFVYNFWFSWPNELFLYFFNSNYFVWDFNHHWEINIFEIARVLRTLILPSRVRLRILYISKTFSIFDIISKRYFPSCLVLLYEKCTPVSLMVYLNKSKHFIPRTATLKLFRSPIPEISLWNFNSWVLDKNIDKKQKKFPLVA